MILQREGREQQKTCNQLKYNRVPLNLTGLEFKWAVNQGSISCIAVFAQASDKNKDFVFIRLAVSLFCCQPDKVCNGWFYL